jgi:hypothetical protein
MVFDTSSGRAELVDQRPDVDGLQAKRCAALVVFDSSPVSRDEWSYITQVAGGGACPPDRAAPELQSYRGRVFARGDKALIRRMVRQRARENGWRRVGGVEFVSPSNDGTFSTANLLVTARKGGLEMCEAQAVWTPGRGYVTLFSKAALLENTGQCVPEADPR